MLMSVMCVLQLRHLLLSLVYWVVELSGQRLLVHNPHFCGYIWLFIVLTPAQYVYSVLQMCGNT